MTQVKSSKGFDGFGVYIAKAMSFDEYLVLIDRLIAEGKSTGPVQNDELLNFSRLNRQRMKRLVLTLDRCRSNLEHCERKSAKSFGRRFN